MDFQPHHSMLPFVILGGIAWLAIIAGDVSPELARDTIASVHVLGALQAPPAVKAALKDRIH